MEGTINARSRSQTLVQAVKNKDIARVEELLNTGIDVNKMYPVPAYWQTIEYQTLLITACKYTYEEDNIDMIELLINRGADVNKDGRDHHISIDNISVPPLIMCIFSDNKDAIELLLKRGADPNIQNIHDGNTPLHYCVKRKKYKILNMLLKYDVDPNIYNHKGDTPLHFCVYEDRYEMAKILFNVGANSDIKNNNGKTAYELSMDYYFNGLNYLGRIYFFLESQTKIRKKTQEAKQKLAFATSLNSRLGVNALNKTAYDLYEEIADIPIEYDHSVYNRERDERRRDPLTKAKQYSAFMTGVQTNTGQFFENARYEPNIMESIRNHLSNMRPDTRLHKRIDQKSKKKTRKRRRKRR